MISGTLFAVRHSQPGRALTSSRHCYALPAPLRRVQNSRSLSGKSPAKPLPTSSVPLFFCSSVLLFLCSPVPLFFCSSVPLFFCSSVPLFFCSSVPLFFCSSVLLFLCSSVLLFLCSAVLLFFCSSVLLFFCSSPSSVHGCLNHFRLLGAKRRAVWPLSRSEAKSHMAHFRLPTDVSRKGKTTSSGKQGEFQ